MGHSKIYNNDSKYVIANVMDDVECLFAHANDICVV